MGAWPVWALSAVLLSGCAAGPGVPAPTSSAASSTAAVHAVDVSYRTSGSGQRVLVLLHGGPGSPAPEYLTQFAALAKDMRLVYYDQRGVGASPDPDPTDPRAWSPEAYVADLERLRQRLGVEKISLLGHSWGGELAALYAAVHPDRVDRLVDLDGAPVDFQARVQMEANMKSRIADLQRQGAVPSVIPPMDDCIAWSRALLAVYAGSADRASRYAPTFVPSSSDQCARDATAQRGSDLAQRTEQQRVAELQGQLKNWTGRVLVMQGADDPFGASLLAHANAAQFPAASVTTVTVPDAGHSPQVDHPDVVLTTISAFLRAD